MPEIYRYKKTQEQIDKIEIKFNYNKVLIRIDDKIEDKKTDSGIIMISPTDMDYNPAAHTDRTGTIWKLPPTLRYDNSPFSMPWKTSVQVQEGDKVWFDYLNSQNCVVIENEDGVEYKLIDYENLYLVKRGEEITPLNGYCMFSDFVIKASSRFDITDGKVDARFGVVEYVAEKNQEYHISVFSDDIEIGAGDKVLFGRRAQRYYLEDPYYMTLGKMLRPMQRKNIVAVMDGDNIARLKTGVVVVRPIKERVTASGIIVPPMRSDKTHLESDVIMSAHPEVSVGDKVMCPKVAPLKIGDDYILTDEEIYYIWKE